MTGCQCKYKNFGRCQIKHDLSYTNIVLAGMNYSVPA